MRDRIATVVVWIATLLVFFMVGSATAAQIDPAGDGSGVVELIKPALEAVMAGHYIWAACALLVVSVTLVRKHGKGRWPWLGTDVGGASLLMLGSFAGALMTALGAATWPTMAMLWQATMIAVMAGGGYKLIKIFLPLVNSLVAKLPTVARVPLQLLLGLIASGIGTSPIAKAQTAGAAAVEDKPAGGLEGLLGRPRDIP